MKRHAPTYDLQTVQGLVERGAVRVTLAAEAGADRLGWVVEDVCECVLAIAPDDFHKTMASEKRPSLFQDVYRPTFRRERLYVKLQILEMGDAVIISFKRR